MLGKKHWIDTITHYDNFTYEKGANWPLFVYLNKPHEEVFTAKFISSFRVSLMNSLQFIASALDSNHASSRDNDPLM